MKLFRYNHKHTHCPTMYMCVCLSSFFRTDFPLFFFSCSSKNLYKDEIVINQHYFRRGVGFSDPEYEISPPASLPLGFSFYALHVTLYLIHFLCNFASFENHPVSHLTLSNQSRLSSLLLTGDFTFRTNFRLAYYDHHKITHPHLPIHTHTWVTLLLLLQ